MKVLHTESSAFEIFGDFQAHQVGQHAGNVLLQPRPKSEAISPDSFEVALEEWQAIPLSEHIARWEALEALESPAERSKYRASLAATNDAEPESLFELLNIMEIPPEPTAVLGGRYQLRPRLSTLHEHD